MKFGFEGTGRLIVTGGASKNEEIVQIIAMFLTWKSTISPAQRSDCNY